MRAESAGRRFVVAGTIFAGPTAVATSVRGRVAPMLNERPGVAWAVVEAVFLLLVLWGGTHALRTWWGIALLGALIAVAVVALRHQTLREFPDRETDVSAGDHHARYGGRLPTDRPGLQRVAGLPQ